MKEIYLLAFLTLITTSMQIHADDSCNDPQTQMEMNLCSSQEYQHADAQLNRNYKELIGKLGKAERQKLKAVQRSWIKFRDLQCEFEASGYEGGSIEPLFRLSCLTRMTEQRTKDLRSMIEDASR